MKTKISYIALLLLALFTVSFIPFNLLHHHAEDDHLASLYSHKIAESHHCELDNNLCDSMINRHCGHPSHLHKTVTKCFACEFHFIKHFESSASIFTYTQNEIVFSYNRFVSAALHSAITRVSNKGPPVLG